MKVNPVRFDYSVNKPVYTKKMPAHLNSSFKGQLGQAAGSSSGILLGLASSFVIGPIGAVIVSIVGCVGGGIAGDKIEEHIGSKNKK